MKISLITPAKKHSRSGNRTTADRWAQMLRRQGHRVWIGEKDDGRPCDAMIAIHAWRSAASIRAYRKRAPHGPLIVALGGTDVNSFLHSDPETTLAAMRAADALVCLHALIGGALPADLRGKLHLVRQSAAPLASPRRPRRTIFGACVVGHLRDEKDPLRTARAARLVPTCSRLQVTHLGKAHTAAFAAAARREMADNPRYHWLGEVPGWRVRKEFGKAHVMVISSVQEGGANVVSEAIAAGVPVIASDIDGNVGLLGADYPGYFPVGDETALADVLLRAERAPKFLATLQRHIDRLAPMFAPDGEAAALAKVLDAVTSSASPAPARRPRG